MSNLGLKQQIELQYRYFKEITGGEPTSCVVKVKYKDGEKKIKSIHIKDRYEKNDDNSVLCIVNSHECIKPLCDDSSLDIHGFKIIQVFSFF
jgi:hypothetical protein